MRRKGYCNRVPAADNFSYEHGGVEIHTEATKLLWDRRSEQPELTGLVQDSRHQLRIFHRIDLIELWINFLDEEILALLCNHPLLLAEILGSKYLVEFCFC